MRAHPRRKGAFVSEDAELLHGSARHFMVPPVSDVGFSICIVFFFYIFLCTICTYVYVYEHSRRHFVGSGLTLTKVTHMESTGSSFPKERRLWHSFFKEVLLSAWIHAQLLAPSLVCMCVYHLLLFVILHTL